MIALKDESIEVKEKVIKDFLNGLVLDLRISLQKDELEHIFNRLMYRINKGGLTKDTFDRISTEILKNYKKYLPFCYASIVTANSNIYPC